jgi:protoporphyrinogen oxidase
MSADRPRIVVLGAGVSGLAAGYFLARTGRYDVTVVERAPFAGGICASYRHDGFVLDHGPHKLYSVIPGILEEIEELMGDRLLRVEKRNSIFLRGHRLDYPLRFSELARKLGLRQVLRLGGGFAIATLRRLWSRREPHNYEEFMRQRFGDPAYELVFAPLASKVWGQPSELHVDVARTRVPSSGAVDVILKLLRIRKETAETNAAEFFYPRAGFGDWPAALQEGVERHGGRVLLNAAVNGLALDGERVTGVRYKHDGAVHELPCDILVSSVPFTFLRKWVAENDEETERLLARLVQRHALLVYVEVDRPYVLEDQWIFFPEREFVFSRVSEQKRFNPELGPPDRTVLTCDFTAGDDEWAWNASDDELVDVCVDSLERAGLITRDEVLSGWVRRARNFYPVYGLDYPEAMRRVLEPVRRLENLIPTGRLGMFNYNNSDHCADMGRFIAQRLTAGDAPRQVWSALEERARGYRIVD